MANESRIPKLSDFPHEYICVDVETTGLDPNLDRMIEVAAIHVKNRDIVDRFSSLVALPDGRKVPEKIRALTGINDDMLSGAPREEKVIPEFYQFISGHVLVGHNVKFDLSFLSSACFRNGYILESESVDTLEFSKKLYKQLKSHSLIEVAKYLGADHVEAHRAEADALMAAKCFERMRTAVTKFDDPDEMWSEASLRAIREAKALGIHTWELPSYRKGGGFGE